jgi:1-acyl-sn-glycerol-3-phosphate acyltransferase
MRPSTLRGVVRGVGFLAFTLALVAVYPVFKALGVGAQRRIRRAWCRGSCRILGLRVRAEGRPFADHPTLFVPNHVSYLDVIVLGSFVDALFIAKAEVDGWPLFGFIARMTGTMFIKRHWRQAKVQRDRIAAGMEGGESYVLFAEGTSSNGLAVGRSFKTSLLSVVEPGIVKGASTAAQAVTLSYLRLADGTPVTPENCDLHAWHSEMEFVPHLWEVLRRGGAEILVDFHEPVTSAGVASRKVLGPALKGAIAARLAERRAAVTGETVPALVPAPAETAATGRATLSRRPMAMTP